MQGCKPGISGNNVEPKNVSRKHKLLVEESFAEGRKAAEAQNSTEMKKISSLLALLVAQQKGEITDKPAGLQARHPVGLNEVSLGEVEDDPEEKMEEDDDSQAASDYPEDTLGEDLDTFGEQVGAVKKREKPSEHAANYWRTGRKVGSPYAKDDWRIRGSHNKVKQLTTAPEARMFRSPDADTELPELRYKDKKELEKQLVTLADYGGAVGHMACAYLASLRDRRVQISATIEEYQQPDIRIEDPASEMIALLTNVKEEMVEDNAKMMIEMIRILGSQFNQILVMRRSVFLANTTPKKNARAIIKKLQPTDEFLFGGQIGDVQRNLHYSQSLNPLSIRQENKGGFKKFDNSFKKGGFKKGGGKPFNSRLARFAKKKKGN